jgi:CHAD domain-containing protein
VRVAAAAGVAFGGDQHVLAERGQVMAAERAAVRRGLAIRRAAHRPPRGLRKLLHAPIVPPLRRRPVTAALLAVGVGVAVAVARAQLERRSAAARPRWERRKVRAALRKGEPLAEGLRRVILEQLQLAIELLDAYPGGEGEETVHEIRKALKRVRALIRVLRGELGPKGYARENTALRDCARRLAGSRDAEVILATLDGLLARDSGKLVGSPAVGALRTQLTAEREAAAERGIRDPGLRGAVAEDLRAVAARVERRKLRERRRRLLAPGLDRVYRQGRRGLRTARRGGDARELHVWRKRVKDLRYVAETLDRRGKSFAQIRGVAREADRLGEILGEEHDLALLHREVRERGVLFAAERKTRRRLLKAITRRRKRLHKHALREGERLYRRKPKRFVRGLLAGV